MSYAPQLRPLAEIEINCEELLAIKRHELLPILEDQYKLNHYADRLIQAQAVLLVSVDPKLSQHLSQTIEQLIHALNESKKFLKPRHFNALQKWLGSDLDYVSKQVEYYKDLDQLLSQADQLSQKLQIEIQKSEARYQQLVGLREQMALHVVAAEEFLKEYPHFVEQHPLDAFQQRLSKKINTLQSLQSHNDIAMAQMYMSQQLAFGLLDRFKEAQQVLIPAWQYHVQQSQQHRSNIIIEKLDSSREALIKMLKRSIHKPPQS